MDSKISRESVTYLSYLIITMHVLSFFCLTEELLGDETEPEWLIDEESWQEDLGLESGEGVLFPLYIQNMSLQELLQIPGLVREDIEKILRLRNEEGEFDIETLQKSGLSEDKIKRILSYFSFRSPLPLSYHHTERYYYRMLEDQFSSRDYRKCEIRNPNKQLGFVSLSNYGQLDPTRNYSYYFSHQSNKLLRNLVLGKYRLSLGQGIAYAPAGGFSKSSATTTHPVKNYSPLRPHSNPYKLWSLEGIAMHLEIGPVDVIPFYSSTSLNASLTETGISTFYPYGTTNNDWHNSTREKIDGMAVRMRYNISSWGFYYSHNRFDRDFVNPDYLSSYRTFGTFLFHRSDEFDLFAEYAQIGNKQGLVSGIRLGRGLFQQLLLYRLYEKSIPTWHGNPFSAQTNFDNEEGIYYGLRIRPSPSWTLNCYFDLWRHPATRHFEKMPTTRTEEYLQLIHKRHLDTFRLKFQHKNYEKYRVLNDLPKIRDEHKTVTSLDWKHDIRSEFSQRCGIEYITRYIPEVKDFKKGVLVFENISWRYRNINLIYQINIYRSDISHYIYERSLDGMWESRPLSGDDIYSFMVIKVNMSDSIKVQGKLGYFFSGKNKNLITQVICRL